MRSILLEFYGFKVEDIRLLADDRATKANIMDRLRWLTKQEDPADQIVFHFSGHGSQIRDRNGDELADGLDELICPHDFAWDSNHYILDDELQTAFQYCQAKSIDVFLDSCHSGTGLRAFSPNTAFMNAVPVDDKYRLETIPRFIQPPMDIQCRQDEALYYPPTKIGRAVSDNINGVLFAGCKSTQTSADAYIGNTYNGAFTYYLCKILRAYQGHIGRSSLVGKLRTSLKFNGYDQIPQIEAARGKLVSSICDQWGE
jgi:hypothetical protein